MPYVWFLMICCIWSSSFILMKKAAVCFTPAEIGFGRVLGGGLALGFVWWRQRGGATLSRADWLRVFGVVILGYSWPYTVQPQLVKLHGSAFIGMTVSFVPLLTIAASVPMLRVLPTKRQVVGVLGAIVCLGTLMVDGLDRRIPIGDLALAISVPLSYAVTNTWIRRSLNHVPALELSFWSLALSSLLQLPLVLGPRPDFAANRDQWRQAFACLAFLGVAGTGLATFLFNKLIREQGPLFPGMVTNLVPIGALLWGWLDHESVTALQVIALVGVLAMVGLVQIGSARKETPTA
jgi:drug/metabolite transporter (DMT)-like permease